MFGAADHERVAKHATNTSATKPRTREARWAVGDSEFIAKPEKPLTSTNDTLTLNYSGLNKALLQEGAEVTEKEPSLCVLCDLL